MPRKKAKKTSRRRDNAVSITGLAEAVMLANVGTRAAFNLSAWDFLSDGWTTASAGKAHGSGQISLHELIYGNYGSAVALAGGVGYSGSGSLGQASAITTPTMDLVTTNLKANWLPAMIQGVAIPVGFRIGKRVMRKPITMANKALKAAGVRSMVKV
jgi:hypothetical protein